ncbi:uncharacterized protein LOC141687107 [Apium graveolens]|uniref:uncharacterized protein LOC141687107 n=1 Tax=Apium graveolens TaxID=4045 RepID=UPI003D797F12
MKRKNRGHEGEVALKLDISKAYDRVYWKFLKKRPIFPKRGLRQGDPLSPYLFLFCVEDLSYKPTVAEGEGQITGCQVNSVAPSITHLLFADDSFLFFKASVQEAASVKDILKRYKLESGQAVNYQKSGIFFSANVRRDKQVEILSILGVTNTISGGKYLGLPSLIGRSKKGAFNFVKERVWRKVQDWQHKNMSKAGKTVMVKNVAQSIPAFSMSCFMLPKSLCSEMEKMMNSYWWGSSSNNNKGLRWHSWSKMATAKCSGGLGFCDLHGFNVVLLGKHVWNFCQHPNSLVARLFRARCFQDKHILQAGKGTGSNFIWIGIWEAKENLKKGFRWIMGDGKNIKAFRDPWLKDKPDFCVEDGPLNGIKNESVDNYFRPGTKEWDVHKVVQAFHTDDVQHVLQTRIHPATVKDRIAWHSSNTGMYTVKTGYQFWLSQNNVESPTLNAKSWNSIWKLQVPYKVRTFIWRFCNNSIPVRNNLRSRGIDIPIICPMCSNDVEHLLHIFFDCPYAKDCWQKANLRYAMQEVESAPVWLLEKMATGLIEEKETVAMTLWGELSYSVGMILRNEVGQFIQGKNMRFQGQVTVLEVEARGVEESIRWIEELGLHNVEIESDSETTVKAMSKTMQYYNEVGHIIELCRVKLQQRQDLLLNHVKKQANCVAHLLARVPCVGSGGGGGDGTNAVVVVVVPLAPPHSLL